MSNFVNGAKQFAEDGLEKRNNGLMESASGPGSSIAATYETRQFIPHLVEEYSIKSILDLGCGDWNWMSTIRDEFPETTYEGWDASEELINEVNEKYGNDTTVFKYMDIIDAEYPSVDMVLCRDVMFHLQPKYTLQVIENMRKAGVKYLLATSFNDIAENVGMDRLQPKFGDWRFYYININIEPFNLGDSMLEYVHEESIANKTHNRFMCFYDLSKS